MKLRRLVWVFLWVGAFFLAGFAAWVLSLPSQPAAIASPPVALEESVATAASLRPPKRTRPLIAIVGLNDATETTDYLMPYGILRRADVADVMLLSTGPGPVKLYPVLTVEPDASIAQFDAQHPKGADYVIVPAMEPNDDPAVLEWIRKQAAGGAVIIGVCAGATVVGASGLLDGKRATTHWYYLKDLLERSPTITPVADRRFVVDGNVATTTGISASMPMMLTLIEAIGGRQKAESVARDLGLAHWDARHRSDEFKLTRPFVTTVLGNTLAFWNRQQLGIALQPGMDEVSLALVADAWSRTYRSRAVTFSKLNGPVVTRSGARLIPDRMDSSWSADEQVSPFVGKPAAAALDDSLTAIATKYGASTAQIVAMQLEYSWSVP
jgi:putative intracellular protease/amidase